MTTAAAAAAATAVGKHPAHINVTKCLDFWWQALSWNTTRESTPLYLVSYSGTDVSTDPIQIGTEFVELT